MALVLAKMWKIVVLLSFCLLSLALCNQEAQRPPIEFSYSERAVSVSYYNGITKPKTTPTPTKTPAKDYLVNQGNDDIVNNYYQGTTKVNVDILKNDATLLPVSLLSTLLVALFAL